MKINESAIRKILQDEHIPFKEKSVGSTDIAKIFELESCLNGHTDSGKILFFKDGNVAYKCHHDSCKGDNIVTLLKKYAPDLLPKNGQYAPKSKPQVDPKSILSAVTTMSDVEEKEIEWLLPGYMPKKQIAILAADGGSGKGGIAVSIVAAITSGNVPAFLQPAIKNPFDIEVGSVLYLTTEDPAAEVLRKRFRNAGADLSKIKIIGMDNPMLEKISFTDENLFLRTLLEAFRPALAVFDPLQSFIPKDIRMGERNHMRKCLSNLPVYGAEFGTTFLILGHTNKREGASGRNRIADSADVWDISRSVMICGYTGDGDVRYFSHEKSNYGRLQDTVLYTIDDDGKICFSGITDQKDRDFQTSKQRLTRNAPDREAAKKCIIEALTGEANRCMSTKLLDARCAAMSISGATLRRAKEELKESGVIKFENHGFGKTKEWHVRLTADNSGIP